jgi:hypothetical protein
MRVPVAGTWLRHIPAGGAALYRPPTPADGRWQRGAAVEGIYLAAEEATVWAEWYRWLAELEIEPLHGLPRELWSYRTNLRSVADLTSAEALAALDLPVSEPLRVQWPVFQDVGEQLTPPAATACCIALPPGPAGYASAYFERPRPTWQDGLSRCRHRGA